MKEKLIISLIDDNVNENESLTEIRNYFSQICKNHLDLLSSNFSSNNEIYEKISLYLKSLKDTFGFIVLYYYGHGSYYYNNEQALNPIDGNPIKLAKIINLFEKTNKDVKIVIFLHCDFTPCKEKEEEIEMNINNDKVQNYWIGFISELGVEISLDEKLTKSFICTLKERNFDSPDKFWNMHEVSTKQQCYEFSKAVKTNCNYEFMSLF